MSGIQKLETVQIRQNTTIRQNAGSAINHVESQ